MPFQRDWPEMPYQKDWPGVPLQKDLPLQLDHHPINMDLEAAFLLLEELQKEMDLDLPFYARGSKSSSVKLCGKGLAIGSFDNGLSSSI